MTINKIKVRCMGKIEIVFQVCKGSDVVRAFCTEQEAKAWIDAR